MKKIVLFLLAGAILILLGFYIGRSMVGQNDSAFCASLSDQECLEHQDTCALCGESAASSYGSCHSIQFCGNLPPVKDDTAPAPAKPEDDDMNMAEEFEDQDNSDKDEADLKEEEEDTKDIDQATTTGESLDAEDDPEEEPEKEAAEESEVSIEPLAIDDFINEMKKNETIAGYLENECLEGEFNCPSGMYYQWEKQDDSHYAIAFISFKAEQEKKDNVFDYSSEIYKVNLKTGEVQRKSNGSFPLLLNLYRD